MPSFATRELTSTDPAAGSDLVYTADENMILRTLAGTFTTNATVANRQVMITLEDSAGNIFFRTLAPAVIPASIVSPVEGFMGAPGISPGANHSMIPLPDAGLRLRPGDVLRVTAVNKQAGDDFSVFYSLTERL